MKRQLITINPADYPLLDGMKFADEGERIHAVMITGKDIHHAGLAALSIVSFLAQSHPNRRLVIVNDGEYTFEIPGVPDERIEQVNLDDKLRLGALRNLAFEHIPENDLWAQWDDDDWHHPLLMTEQYNSIIENKVEGCFLHNQLRYAFSRNAAWFAGCREGFAGTIMARNKPEMRYPSLRKGEDSVFVEEFQQKYPFFIWQNPEYYYLRFIHGHNTWEDEHFRLKKRWRGSRRGLDAEARRYLKSILPLYKPVIG